MKKHLFSTIILLITATTFSAAQTPDSVKHTVYGGYPIEKRLNIDISLGVGFGRMEFRQIGAPFVSAHLANQYGFPDWNAGVGINWYFLPWMGIGTGIHFSTYANMSRIEKPWIRTDFDYQGHLYAVTATPNNLSEQQGIYMAELPISLRFRTIKHKVGFHGVAGVKLGMPVYDYYRLSNGSFTTKVAYEYWGLTIPNNIPGVIEDFNITQVTGNMGQQLRSINLGAYAEVGMLFSLHQRLDLMLAVSGTYYFNDVLTNKSTAALGFDESFPKGAYPAPFGATYNGVLRTSEVQELHPWSLSLKVGLSIHAGKTQAKRDFDREERARRRAEREADRLAREAERLARLEEEERARREADSLRRVEEANLKCSQMNDRILNLLNECGIDLCDLCPIIHDTLYITVHDTIRIVERQEDKGKQNRRGEASAAVAPVIKSNAALPTVEVVRKGSRLAQIARRYYNNHEYWVFIYEANKDKISDPNIIPVKMEIVVPDLNERLKGKSADEIEQIINNIKASVRKNQQQ